MKNVGGGGAFSDLHQCVPLGVYKSMGVCYSAYGKCSQKRCIVSR